MRDKTLAVDEFHEKYKELNETNKKNVFTNCQQAD